MLEIIDVFGYVFSFWFFIFNKKFRVARLNELKKANRTDRLFHYIEALFSMLLGLGIPIIIIYLIISY